jgi:hypothetical protein
MLSEATRQEAAKHSKGATIKVFSGGVYDLADPDPSVISLDDLAYGLAYTVRFRGQCRVDGRRVFYGVAEHNVRGAEWLLVEGYSAADALAFLHHEDGELPFGDLPGPGKSLFPGWREREKDHCAKISARFDVETPDPDLIKRWDIRMYCTERRDLMGEATEDEPLPGYGPFPGRIVPFPHPDQAADRFLTLERTLRQMLATTNTAGTVA